MLFSAPGLVFLHHPSSSFFGSRAKCHNWVHSSFRFMSYAITSHGVSYKWLFVCNRLEEKKMEIDEVKSSDGTRWIRSSVFEMCFRWMVPPRNWSSCRMLIVSVLLNARIHPMLMLQSREWLFILEKLSYLKLPLKSASSVFRPSFKFAHSQPSVDDNSARSSLMVLSTIYCFWLYMAAVLCSRMLSVFSISRIFPSRSKATNGFAFFLNFLFRSYCLWKPLTQSPPPTTHLRQPASFDQQ